MSKTIMESKNGGFEEDCVFHFGPGFSVPCFVFWVGGPTWTNNKAMFFRAGNCPSAPHVVW